MRAPRFAVGGPVFAASRARPVPLASVAFVRAYVVTMRPYLLFVSGITGIAGMALVAGVPTGAALGLGVAFFLSYGFGQALTDCFQLDTDSISSPYRPLVQGTVSRLQVLGVSAVGLSAVGAALVAANPWNLPLVASAVLGLATYTWFKRRWWAGPFYNAWIVAALMMTGVLSGLGAAGHGGPRTLVPAAGPAGLLGAVFFGYANFVLVGYFKDITADRITGYETLPVRAGRYAGSLVSDGLAVCTVVGALVAAEAARAAPVSAAAAHDLGLGAALVAPVLLGAGCLAVAIAQIRLHAVRKDEEAHRAIVPTVHAYLLLLAGVTAANRPEWAPALVAFLVCYFLTMRARPARAQV